MTGAPASLRVAVSIVATVLVEFGESPYSPGTAGHIRRSLRRAPSPESGPGMDEDVVAVRPGDGTERAAAGHEDEAARSGSVEQRLRGQRVLEGPLDEVHAVHGGLPVRVSDPDRRSGRQVANAHKGSETVSQRVDMRRDHDGARGSTRIGAIPVPARDRGIVRQLHRAGGQQADGDDRDTDVVSRDDHPGRRYHRECGPQCSRGDRHLRHTGGGGSTRPRADGGHRRSRHCRRGGRAAAEHGDGSGRREDQHLATAVSRSVSAVHGPKRSYRHRR
jgi:hypothetical protein